MTAPGAELVTQCNGCPCHPGKTCGHQVLYGPGACWKRDGRPERCVGLQDGKSPFAGESDDCEAQ